MNEWSTLLHTCNSRNCRKCPRSPVLSKTNICIGHPDVCCRLGVCICIVLNGEYCALCIFISNRKDLFFLFLGIRILLNKITNNGLGNKTIHKKLSQKFKVGTYSSMIYTHNNFFIKFTINYEYIYIKEDIIKNRL